jgi:allophanate hydrolase
MPLPYSLDLTRLSAAYAARELTPVAVVRDVLAEVERTRGENPAWIHVIARQSLLERATDLERRHASGERLPLYGVPFAVKDNIDVAGQPTTAACPAYSYVASATAYAVQRLEQAGAVCIGKTNMDQFATGLVGTRSPYGACKNPFDARYISGGSSSGSAVAVALGQVSFALGTDTAGSGRVPAAFCNVVGLKPTRGLISMRGVVPACRSLDCVSVFALTCEDAWTVSAALTAYDSRDPFSGEETPRPARTPITRVRCGVLRESDLRFFGDEAARYAYGRTLESLQALGAELVEIDYRPYAETARLLYEGPWVAERLAAIGPFYRSSAEQMDPVVRTIIAGGDRYGARETFEAQYRLQALKRECAQGWREIDMLMVPTAGTVYRLEEVAAEPVGLNANLGYYTNFVNLLDLAAIAVPADFRDDGLPSGVTLIAPALEDATLAQWGARLHRAVAIRLGATLFPLPERGAPPASAAHEGVTLAVVGAHLSGLPLNHQLTARGASLLETCSTAPCYRLYALPDATPPKPGLARARNGSGAAIEVELWSVPVERFGSFVADVSAPLAIGTVTLADGRQVKGFVCESYALDGARDISDFGGWRSYVEAELIPASEIQ